MFRKKKDELVSESDKSEALKILMSNIPNYVGYKKLETRRNSDLAYRKRNLELLQQSGDMVSQIKELLIHSQLLTTWGQTEMIVSTVQKLRKEVSNTDYKYSTFFDVIDVEGENGIDLAILYLLEIEILDANEEFKEKAKEIATNLDEMVLENAEEDIKYLYMLSMNLTKKISDRNELLRAIEKMSL